MEYYVKQLSKDLEIINITETDEEIHLFLRSNVQYNNTLHSKSFRVVKDINLGNKRVILHMETRKFFVTKTTISRKVFSEEFGFVDRSGRRTKRLNDFLLKHLKETSAIGLERLLQRDIVNISDTTILRILKKTLFDQF